MTIPLNYDEYIRIIDGLGVDVYAPKPSMQLDTGNLTASQDFILVDVSDTTLFKHQTGDHIHMFHLDMSFDESTAFRGQVKIGFLVDVDATDGDFHTVLQWDFENAASEFEEDLNFNNPLIFNADHHVGDITANDTAFQTDVALSTVRGGTAFSGTGDVILRIIRTAGNVEIDSTMQYQAFPAH